MIIYFHNHCWHNIDKKYNKIIHHGAFRPDDVEEEEEYSYWVPMIRCCKCDKEQGLSPLIRAY